MSMCVSAALAGPRDAALIIANKVYQNGADNVEFSDRDGAEFARMAREVLGIPEANVTHLSNQTYAQLVSLFGRSGVGTERLRSLFRHPDTTLYVLYTGHGVPAVPADASDAKPVPMVLPVDTPLAEVGSFGLSIKLIEGALARAQRERAPQGRVIVFFDACFSGKSGSGRDLIRGTSAAPMIDPAALRRSTEASLSVLSAAMFDQVAYWDPERRHGAFSDAVVEGLYGAADNPRNGGNGDKVITMTELKTYVERRVKLRLDHLFPDRSRLQTPDLAGDGNVVLVRLGDYMVRDRKALNDEQTLCKSLGTDRTEVEQYLRACSSGLNSCVCQVEAGQKLTALNDLADVCRSELARVDILSKRGASAKDELTAFARTAKCPDVKAKVEGLGRPPPRKEPQISPEYKQAARLPDAAAVESSLTGYIKCCFAYCRAIRCNAPPAHIMCTREMMTKLAQNSEDKKAYYDDSKENLLQTVRSQKGMTLSECLPTDR
jgi:hypothetical protein